jgi:thiosulfate/3-mercaptopyruvate sulfurtransferase
VPFETLVDVQTLAAHLDDPAWLVVDCRHTLADFGLGRRLYTEAHIPGAFFADMEHDLAGEKTGRNGRHPLPDPETFAGFLRALGASDATQIVAYDVGADMSAPRLWFLCKWIGHDSVAVLDGGIGAWTAAGKPTTADTPAPRARGSIQVRLRPELVVDAAFVKAHLDDPRMQLLDARASDRFAGQNELVDPVAGHIPGASNRWFKDNFREDLTMKSPAELQTDFERFGDAANVVNQCGSGVSGAANMLAMEHAGRRGSRLYAGSWSEWISDPSRPLATGP